MMRLTILCVSFAIACGGSQQSQVPEVPIDQGGGAHAGGGSDLPPDEVGEAGATSSVALPDSGPPPGVGPQPLDVASGGDAGATQSGSTFTHRQGGLTEKECDDLVMTFAKLTAKDKHDPAPVLADVQKDAIYSQMITDCGATTTKKQQRCGLATHTTDAWKKCMQ